MNDVFQRRQLLLSVCYVHADAIREKVQLLFWKLEGLSTVSKRCSVSYPSKTLSERKIVIPCVQMGSRDARHCTRPSCLGTCCSDSPSLTQACVGIKTLSKVLKEAVLTARRSIKFTTSIFQEVLSRNGSQIQSSSVLHDLWFPKIKP